MLEIPTHAQDRGAKDIHDERPQRKRGDTPVEVYRDVEAAQTAQWREYESEERAAAPDVWCAGVAVWGQGRENNGASPATPREKYGNAVEEFASDCEGDDGGIGLQGDGDVTAHTQARDGHGDGGDNHGQ